MPKFIRYSPGQPGMFAGAMALLLGSCCVHGLSELPDARVLSAPLGLALVMSLVLRWRLLASCLAGFAWTWGHAALQLANDLPAALEGEDVEVAGYVASIPEATAAGPRFMLDVVHQPGAGQLPRRIELTWYDAPALPAAGERWQFTVRLRRRHGFANPGGFDYEAQLFRERIGATGYVREAGENVRLSEPSWRYPVLRLRAVIADRLGQVLAGNPQLGIVQGLSVGERQNMTPEQWRVFAATGTSHLMAISGLHIAMVAALSAGLGGCAVRLPGMQRRRFTAVDGRAAGGICGALIYSALAGFGVPAQRTLVMLAIYCGARLLRRELRATQGLGLSIVAVLVLDPFAPLSVGAWLSFGAVGAILWLLSGRVRERGSRRGLQLKEFLKVQGAVTLGLLPLLVVTFGAVSLVSPLVNLLAIPFFTLIVVPLVLVASAGALLLPAVGEPLLAIAAWLLDLAWPALAAAATLAHSVWYPASSPLWAVLLLGLGAALACAPGFAPTRLAGALLCLPALFWQPVRLGPGEFRLTVLDVGQGLAATIETRSHTLLYDAGPAFQSGRDTGEMVVLPYLRSRGVRRLDAVIVSHGDLDHAGGMPSVLAGMPVDRVLASPSVQFDNVEPEPCVRGLRWQWDGVEFSTLHPDPESGFQSDNDASCVLHIKGVGGSAVLLGDIERSAEAELVESSLVGSTGLVVAAHHGSRTSSTPALVDALAARHVLFAVGYRNRWGFPRPDVVERWQAAGALAHTTAGSGAIGFLVSRAGIQPPDLYRQTHRRYWHAEAEDPEGLPPAGPR